MPMDMAMARVRVSPQNAEWMSRARWSALVPVFGLAFVPATGWGGDWQLSKSVSISTTYTDNVHLDETNKKGELFASVTPSFSLQGKGGRADANISGSLRLSKGTGGTGSIAPSLRGSGKVEVVRQHFFVEGNASVQQSAINPFGPIGTDDLNDTGNTTTSMQLSVSPYYKGRIQGVGNLEARYRSTATLFSGSAGDRSGDHLFNLSLTSGPDFSRLSWGARASYRLTDYEGENSLRSQTSTDIDLGYRFNRKWSVDGSVGREWNDLPTTRDENGGFRWSLNTTWTPNPRTTVRVGYGDRYFGSTPTLDVSYRRRKATLQASYSKVLTDTNTELQAIAIDPVTGTLFPVAILNKDVFVDERFTGTLSLAGKRSTVTLSGTHSQQNYENSARRSELTKLGVSATRTLSGRVSANASLNWYQQDESATQTAQTWQARLGMSFKVGPKSSLSVNYSFNQRDDDRPGESYEENRVSAAFSVTL